MKDEQYETITLYYRSGTAKCAYFHLEDKKLHGKQSENIALPKSQIEIVSQWEAKAGGWTKCEVKVPHWLMKRKKQLKHLVPFEGLSYLEMKGY